MAIGAVHAQRRRVVTVDTTYVCISHATTVAAAQTGSKAAFLLSDDHIVLLEHTAKIKDSYTYSLKHLLSSVETADQRPVLNYVYMDDVGGSFEQQALGFMLIDKMLGLGGVLEIVGDGGGGDERGGDAKAGSIVGATKDVVELLIKTDARYQELLPSRIFQKTSLGLVATGT